MAKSGELFPEKNGFMIANQNQVICTSNYWKYILKDPNTTNDISRKCREKLKTIQNIIGVYRARALGDFIPRQNQVSIKNWPSHVDCQWDHQCHIIKMSLNPCQKTPTINYDRSIITDQTIHNNRKDSYT